MEYCDLGDLSYFIKKKDSLDSNPATAEMIRKYPNSAPGPNGGLNEVITRHFLKQLASALEFLRARNFIHRDVKPQNLLLLPSKKYLAATPDSPLIMSVTENSMTPTVGLDSLPMLKLADFGFARSLPATSLAETLCGSPLYMAPEILRYEKYDAKADLWSVGTVLYEMCCGKPPFRAGNHVELLRKIEQSNDEIRFTPHSIVSRGMKNLIRALLKRNPTERMSFENFFAHDVIVEDIPGLVEDDIPKKPTVVEELVRRGSLSHGSRGGRGVFSEADSRALKEIPSSAPSRGMKPGMSPEGTSPRAPLRVASSSNTTQQQGLRPANRPTLKAANTTPAMPVLGGTSMGRGNSQDTASPGSSLFPEGREAGRQDVAIHKQNLPPTPEQLTLDDQRMDLEYVMIDKLAIDVNTFADHMDARTQEQTTKQTIQSPRSGAIVRRATTQCQPASPIGAASPQSSRAVQISQGKSRPDHARQSSSYERRYAPSPTSLTSMLGNAVGAATIRLRGVSFDRISPQLFGGKGGSPTQIYCPWPAYPSQAGIPGLIADGKANPNLDEDSKAVLLIEESATRSDVVYGFAEVKYRQLIPLPPSMDHGLGGNTVEKGVSGEDDDLTPEATVELSEEALVLYVKSLTLLAKSMDYASGWWVRKNRGEIIPAGSLPRSNSPSVVAAGNRINNAVQWVRSRFNEVLDKAEFVRLKLIQAQGQLPTDHPGHPNNHTSTSNIVGGASTDGVVLSSGVTAEKLMYDRALEMSRTAAVSEIANEDLPGCEMSYVTAIRLLEAVLEQEGESTATKPAVKEEGSDSDGINLEDREAVQGGKLILCHNVIFMC